MTGCLGNVRPRVLSAASTLLCWVVLAAPAFAQTLSGIVRDPTGHVMANVLVAAVDEVTTKRRETTTSALGQYAFRRLPPGDYTVIVNSPPFRAEVPHLRVERNRLTGADIVLKVTASDSTTVRPPTVESPSALVLHDGSIGTLFSRPFLETMPLINGHTLQSLFPLVPGIVMTESTGTLAQFTAGGQRRFANRLTIDGIAGDLGVNVASPGLQEADSGALPAFATTGGTQTLVPLGAIEEIEVRTTNASAEYSRTPGAQMVVVTKAGSNRFSASGFGEARPYRWGATDWFDNYNHRPKRAANYWNTGVTAGGPLLPKRLFYFGTFERQVINRDVAGTLPVPSLATRESAPDEVRPLLDAFPTPNGPERDDGLADFSYRYPILLGLNSLSLRFDGNLSDSHRVFTRINKGRSSGDGLGVTNLPPTSVSVTEATSTTTATVGLTSTWSTVTHEFRANASSHRGSAAYGPLPYGDSGLLPFSLLLPSTLSEADAWVRVVLFNGPGGFLVSGPPEATRHKQLQVVDTWSFALGRHDWRFGIDFRHATTANDPPSARVLYRFGNIANLFQGRVQTVGIEEFLPARTGRIALSMFAQDAFRVSPRLSLNAGLRYSIRPSPQNHTVTQPTLVAVDALPELVYEPRRARLWNTSWTDFGPNVAATYQLGTTDAWETILRTGWSVVFDELTSPGITAFDTGYPFVQSRTLPPFLPFPVSASNLAASSAVAVPGIRNYFAFPTDFRTPRTHEWQVGIEQALGRGHRIGLAYIGAAGRELAYWYAVDAENREARVHAFSNEGTSDYHALAVEYVRRLSRGLQGRIAYTWGHAIDTDSGEATTPPLPPNISPPSLNRASADYDRRQLFQATASYYLPTLRGPSLLRTLCADWHVDLAAVVITGAPVSITVARGAGFRYRPDLVAGVPMWVPDSESPTGQRINREALEVPVELRQGTLGRNALRASALRQVNLGIARSLRLRGRMTAQLRLEAFNVFNTPSFGPPAGNISVDQFGTPSESYADALGKGTLNGGGLVPLLQAGGPRSLQLGLRVVY